MRKFLCLTAAVCLGVAATACAPKEEKTEEPATTEEMAPETETGMEATQPAMEMPATAPAVEAPAMEAVPAATAPAMEMPTTAPAATAPAM